MNKIIKKFLFLGSIEDKQLFFAEAQEAGIIHFIDPDPKSSQDIPQDVRHITSAIKILRGLPTAEQEENLKELNADIIVNEIIDLQNNSDRFQEEIRTLSLEIARVFVLGSFSLEDLAYIEKTSKNKIQFFNARSNSEEPIPDSLIYLASDHGLDYYMSINSEPVSYDKMIEIKIDHSLDDLNSGLKKAKKHLHDTGHELKKYAKYNDYLHDALIGKLNRYHLYDAQSYVQAALGGSLFAVEGWVPENKIDLLDLLTDRLNIHFEEVVIEPEDIKPTYLENRGLGRLGEDLVHIYDTPSPTDKDPSKWVLYAFALFFAFIIGDAGYGLIYLSLALFLKYKFREAKGDKQRFINLFIFLSSACVIWGTLMTSFFGMQIDYNNPLRKVSMGQWLAKKRMAYDIAHEDLAYRELIKKYPELANEKDPNKFLSFVPPKNPSQGNVILSKLVDNTLFELALFIGVVHLVLSLLRYCLRNWAHIGWVIFLIGAYLHFSASLNIPSFMNTILGIDLAAGGKFGLQLIWLGIGLACLLSIIQNGWLGIFEPMNLIQIFADSLSYLRLYALALAGAIVGSTVNGIAAGIPTFFAILLIVGSHLINIVLGTMSGIIHGLRLNYLEWYRWSFEGGGKQFKPLKLLQKD